MDCHTRPAPCPAGFCSRLLLAGVRVSLAARARMSLRSACRLLGPRRAQAPSRTARQRPLARCAVPHHTPRTTAQPTHVPPRPLALPRRSKYDPPSTAPSPCLARADPQRSFLGPSAVHSIESASQRSAGSYSQHSSQDGAVLGRFPKPAAGPFRTPVATPSLESGLVNSLLRQQAERDEAIRRLNDEVNSMEGAIATLKEHNAELVTGQKRRAPAEPGAHARARTPHPRPDSRPLAAPRAVRPAVHEEMIELKQQHRASAEHQDRRADRLERGQDEILSFFQQQKVVAPSLPASRAPSIPSSSPRFRATPPSSQHHRPAMVPRMPSPSSHPCDWKPFRASPAAINGSSVRMDLPSSRLACEPQRALKRRVPLDGLDGGGAASQPRYPLSPTPSTTPSSRSAVIFAKPKPVDLFDDEEEEADLCQADLRQADFRKADLRQACDEATAPAAARVGGFALPAEKGTGPLRTFALLRPPAERASVVLGATSLAGSGSKRAVAPSHSQSRRYERHEPARREVLLSIGGPSCFDYDED